MSDYSSSWNQPKKKVRDKKLEAQDRSRMQTLMRRIQGMLTPLLEGGMPEPDRSPVAFRLMLLDLTFEGLTFFAVAELPPGQLVEVKADLPDWYALQANILWCNKVQQTSGLVKVGNFDFRMGIQWVFSSDEEKEQFKRVLESFHPTNGTARASVIVPSIG